jgi:hypothetical protein
VSAAASISVRVPLAVRRRPGRKTVVTPEGAATSAPARSYADPAMLKALARAHRWQRMLDEGRYASISEMAVAEKLDRGYLGRVLQLTLLAPDVMEAILDGKQPQGLGLPALMEPFPAEWQLQRVVLQAACPAPPPPRHRLDAAAGTRPPGAHSMNAPEMRTSSATLGSSAAKIAANSSGVPPTGS